VAVRASGREFRCRARRRTVWLTQPLTRGNHFMDRRLPSRAP